MGLGPCVRVSKSVSHGLGLCIAYGESKRRGRGSSTAVGHTGNGHGPRALGAGLRGAGRGPGHRPRRVVTWAARLAVCPPRGPWVGTRRPALGGPRLQWPGGTRAAHPQPVTPGPQGRRRREAGQGPAARTYDGGSGFAEAMTAITCGPGGLAAQPPWHGGGAGAGEGLRSAGAGWDAAVSRGQTPASLVLQCESLPED